MLVDGSSCVQHTGSLMCEWLQDIYNFEYNYLKTNTDGIEYVHFPRRFYDDKAAIGLSHICRLASEEGKRIYISGSGADETLNDYGAVGWASAL